MNNTMLFFKSEDGTEFTLNTLGQIEYEFRGKTFHVGTLNHQKKEAYMRMELSEITDKLKNEGYKIIGMLS